MLKNVSDVVISGMPQLVLLRPFGRKKMSRTTKMLAAAAGATLISSAAYASISFVGLQQVPITPAALSADPTLANFTSYDLMVSISSTDHWAAAGLNGALVGGSFYIPASFNADTGLQSVAQFVPNLTFDTFVSRPGYADPGDGAILGSQSGAAKATMPGSPNTNRNNTPNVMDVAWGDVNATGNPLTGVQAIARLTIANSALIAMTGAPLAFYPPVPAPTPVRFEGVLKITSDPNSAAPVRFFPVPEPTSLALMSLGLGAVALRRRK